ncbi:hypothetical protein, partial [Endozoicomonas sp. ONNA1]|uniref:hypothetical protein n=1 Tax=Endozoicomonas sp. ONNA1 TaxID=2828740 RepID=UPI002147495B
IASGDQPPELQRLGQSLFVNDEALLAAATSAYFQVHVLGGDLQQQALNELLAHSKPVGYVVHVGDDAQVSAVPAGYPKLEVAETPGEVIVFHGQKLNPRDTAFVEKLHNLWKEAEGNNLAPAWVTKINIFRVKSFQHVIRSRQMALLEEFVARHNAEVSKNQPTTLTNEDRVSGRALAFYEYLQQALATADQDRAITVLEFEFTLEHIRAASSAITPTWLQIQLTKHFSFKPLLRDFLSHQNVVQGIMGLVPVVDESQLDVSYDNDRFAFKVLSDMTRQLIKSDSKLIDQLKRERKLTQVNNHLKIMLGKATAIEKQKLIVLQLKYQAEHDLRQLHGVSERQQSLLREFRQKVERIPGLEKQIRNARAEATKARNARLAEELGIEDWDDCQSLEKQARLISIKIHAINKALATTGQPEGESIETTLPALERQLGIIKIDEKDLDARFQCIQERLRQHPVEPYDAVFRETMAIAERQLGLVPENEDDLVARQRDILQAIQQQHKQRIVQIYERLQHQKTRRDAETKASYATIAEHLNLQNFDRNVDIDAQLNQLLQRIETLNAQLQSKHILNLQQKNLFDRLQSLNTQGTTLGKDQEHLLQKIQALNAQCCMEEPDVKTEQDGLALILRIRLDEDSTTEEDNALKTAMYQRFSSLQYLEEELKDIRTPGHPKAMPVVLEKLSDVEKALDMDDLNSEDDVYYRRNAISEEIQTRMTKVRQQEEKVALKMLKTVEDILKIEVNNGDDKTARLDRVRTKLDSGEVSESTVDTIKHSLRKEGILFRSQAGNTELQNLQRNLDFYVENVSSRAATRQSSILKIIEDKLHIYDFVREEADEKGGAFVAKLANDLGIIFRRKAYLPEKKYVLEKNILALMEEVDEAFGDEDVRRSRNNEIAHQLNIKSYEDDAGINDQNILIKEKLQELYEEVPKVGVTTVNEHIAAIEGELDRQMARLGPKPRYVLDREVASARQTIQQAESELAAVHRRLIAVSGKHLLFAGQPADLRDLLDEENMALNQAMKQVQIELDLAAVDEQTSEERLRDFSHFLRGYGRERQGEILNELNAKTGLSIQIKDEFGSVENALYCIGLANTDSHVQNEDNEALGELFLAKRKYFQIRKFVDQHYIKSSDLVNAQIEQWNAKEKLELKEKEMIDPGDIDQKAKTLHMNEMDRLGLILKQASDAVSKAQKALVDHHEAALDATEEAAGLKPDSTDTCEHRISALLEKLLQLGGYDGNGGKIRQLLKERLHLRSEIGVRKADIGRMREVLKAAEKAVENDGGPFQFSPRQVNVLADMNTFTQQHSLKQQALDAALGLTESAFSSGKTIPCLTTFDF